MQTATKQQDKTQINDDTGTSHYFVTVVKLLVAWTLIGATILWWVCFIATWEWGTYNIWTKLYFEHLPVTMGIPSAGVGAIIICALFRSSEGAIKFRGLGFTFEGASGPIVMWFICFLALTVSIRFLWPLTWASQ